MTTEVASTNDAQSSPGQEDEVEKLIGLLEESDAIPEEVKQVDSGDSAAQGKAAHAFAELKRKAKRLAEELKKERQLRESLEKKPTAQVGSVPVSMVGPQDVSSAADAVLTALTLEAQRSLGIPVIRTDAERELVRMERDRLWHERIALIRKTEEAKRMAPSVIESELSRYSLLDEKDKAEIKKRLSSLSPVEQTDGSVIRRVVVEYVGERALEGGPPSEASATRGDVKGSGRSVKAAASMSLSGSSSASEGVRLGGVDTSTQPQPPTEEELQEMRKYGFSDIEAFRAAKKRINRYKGG
ncbi:MAG: hypothetical protein QXT73_01140 [Candidatus Methanomethylicaceae archaeon]